MRKRILFLSFYFEPDLCAGSFRNSPLAHDLASQAKVFGVDIDVMTTLPNRYSTYSAEASKKETHDNLTITRIQIPFHQNGIKDQIKSFKVFFDQVSQHVKGEKYDLVYASSSRLFTAFLGYRIAKRLKVPLYLDIRDIFVDTIKDVFSNFLIKTLVLPVLKYVERKTFSYASHINLISGGFKEYFKSFSQPVYSYYSNGIDPEFLNSTSSSQTPDSSIKIILYAGNIGEGQGLHKIIPQAARKLGTKYKFKVIGDGGAKNKLLAGLNDISNVEILPPMSRALLIEQYKKADFLFIHLNDFEAFKKVLPSKVFELGVFPKPLIAGVNGFSREFIRENLSGSILVEPCNSDELVTKVLAYKGDGVIDRSRFIESFKREHINKKMSESILNYLLGRS